MFRNSFTVGSKILFWNSFAIASKQPSFVHLVSCQKTSLVLLDADKLWLPSHRRFLCTLSCGTIITIIRMIVINTSTSSVIVIIITTIGAIQEALQCLPTNGRGTEGSATALADLLSREWCRLTLQRMMQTYSPENDADLLSREWCRSAHYRKSDSIIEKERKKMKYARWSSH